MSGPAELSDMAKARRLIGQRRLAEAERLLERHLETQREDKAARWLLVDCLEQQKEWQKARDLIRQLLGNKSRDPRALNRLGLAELHLGNGVAAAEAFAAALTEDPENVLILLNHGQVLQGLGRLEEARPVFERAHALQPDFNTAFLLAKYLVRRLQFKSAQPLLLEALRLAPDTPNILLLLSHYLLRAGAGAGAESCLQRVLENQPEPGAIVAALEQCFQGNFHDKIRTYLPPALTRFPADPRLLFLAARLDHLDGRREEARERLLAIKLPAADHRRLYWLGQVEDRLNNPEGAMAAFSRANQLQKEAENGEQLAAIYRNSLQALEQAFTSAQIAQWSPTPPSEDDPPPVFLVGFPRSGTTLLDTILMSHPAVVVVEEAPTLKGIDAFLGLEGKKPIFERLAHLSHDEWTALRKDYRERLAEYHDGSRSMVIDKLPLNLVKAGILHRIFPEAKFILLLRHPCDAVLSNFMQFYQLNPAMAHMLDLVDAAKLYDRVMALWRRYDEIFPLHSVTLRYEDLVQDVGREMKTLLAFLGLDYDPAVENHTRSAMERGFVATPSYNQITQPVYRRAVGRWQRYAEAMAPVRPVLDPWCRHWGYE